MSRVTPRRLLRLVAYVVPLLILCSIVAFLLFDLKEITDIRRQLRNTDGRITQLSTETQDAVDGLSRGLSDLSQSMQNEIALARRSTGWDVSHMGNRLSGRLDEMARRMADIAVASQSAVSISAVDNAGLAAHAEQDLAAAHKMEDARALFDSGKYGQAQKSFFAVLAAQPENVDARLHYAASLYRANPADASNYSTIEKNLRSVLSNDAENLLALETLAMVEIERQKWSDALGHLKILTARQTGNPSYLKSSGYCSLKIGDTAAARAYFESAVRASPTDREALSYLGDCESSLGNAMAAEQDWNAALATLDLKTAAGIEAGMELRVRLAKSAYGRGAYQESVAYAHEGNLLGKSELLRAYEGLSLSARGNKEAARVILQGVSSSSDAQAAALAKEALQENQQ